MKIGGFQEFSLIDYPGKMAAVVFTQGCNFRCPYCHNSELSLPELYGPLISEEKVLSFLKKRVNRLESVVITGGEATLQKELIPFIQRVKLLGYSVKLDTNGSQPDVIADLIKYRIVDYIAMDVKASMKNYHTLAGRTVDFEQIKASVRLIANSEIKHEFRTTIVKPLHTDIKKELQEIYSLIKNGQRFRLQKFVANEKVMDQSLCRQKQFTDNELQNLKEKWGFNYNE